MHETTISKKGFDCRQLFVEEVQNQRIACARRIVNSSNNNRRYPPWEPLGADFDPQNFKALVHNVGKNTVDYTDLIVTYF